MSETTSVFDLALIVAPALWFIGGFLLQDWLERFPRFEEWVNNGDA